MHQEGHYLDFGLGCGLASTVVPCLGVVATEGGLGAGARGCAAVVVVLAQFALADQPLRIPPFPVVLFADVVRFALSPDT